MLSQELAVRLKAMPSEAMVMQFSDLVQGQTEKSGDDPHDI